MRNNILYIGLNGLAGSGKDTVAKMLKTILMKHWGSLEECKNYYKSVYTNPTISATFNAQDDSAYSQVLCLAYADQLKYICASIYGIPVERFYMNKSNAWICVNQKFQYTEIRPDENICTAEEYYYSAESFNEKDVKVWMSLREILVYVGTYVLQSYVNRNIFVNIVRNKVNTVIAKNHNLKYVIVTDNRFYHELEFIKKEKSGVTITITRDSVKQLDNIAEHNLDDEENYDFIIENNDGYDELFEQVWNIVYENKIFYNSTLDLLCRENIHNYLRLIDDDEYNMRFMVCAIENIQRTYHDNGEITMIDLVGGPTICVGELLPIEGDNSNAYVSKIEFDNKYEKFIVSVKK